MGHGVQVRAMWMTPEKQEEVYNEIMKFYDFAEDIIDVVEKGKVANAEAHVPLVEEFVEKIEKYTEMLAETFIVLAQANHKPSQVQEIKIESALTKIEEAVELFYKKRKNIH